MESLPGRLWAGLSALGRLPEASKNKNSVPDVCLHTIPGVTFGP